MKKLLSLRQGLDSGIWTAPHPLNPRVFWQDGANVLFRNGAVQKMDGLQAMLIAPSNKTVIGLGQLLHQAGPRLCVGTKDSLHIWDGSALANAGSGYNGTLTETPILASTQWSILPWGQWFFATNGIDMPQVWKGSGSFTTVGGMAAASISTVSIFARRGPHLIAIGTNAGIAHVAWSSADKPEEWTATSVNSAGSLFIREADSEIIAAVPLADRLACYTREQMFLLEYIREPYIFGYAPALKGIGAVSKNSVVAVDRLNFGLARQGFFMTDGSRFEWIDDPAVRTWFFQRVNWTQRSKIVGYHDEDSAQVIWFYPASDTVQCSHGLGFDYQRRVWTLYNYGQTAAIEREVWANPITGAVDGFVYEQHSGYDFNTVALHAFVESGPLDLGNHDAQKTVLGAKLAVSGVAGTGVKVQIGGKQNLTDPIQWSETLTVGTGHDMVHCDVTGRWIHVRLLSSESGVGWSVTGLDLYGITYGNIP